MKSNKNISITKLSLNPVSRRIQVLNRHYQFQYSTQIGSVSNHFKCFSITNISVSPTSFERNYHTSFSISNVSELIYSNSNSKSVEDFTQRFMDAYQSLSTNENKIDFLKTFFELQKHGSHTKDLAILTAESILKSKHGVRFLLDLRSDLLKIIASNLNNQEDATSFRSIDAGIQSVLSKSFDPSMLKLQTLTMNSPAIVFKRIIENERVHAYKGEGWYDIQQRVGIGRRLFYFEHPQMELYPLAFLHTAYTKNITTSIQSIFQPVENDIEEKADTAIFYSISSIEQGLKGIEIGAPLIKRSVDYIQRESPHISHFYTLSPIPQFLPWLKKTLQTRGSALITQQEVNLIKEIINHQKNQQQNQQQLLTSSIDKLDLDNVHVHLLNLVNMALKSDKEFIENAPKLLIPWKFTLMKLCSIYMLKEKDTRGNALDPVTNFHIRNGARIARLNWNGNMNKYGLSQSFGIMTNYQYELNLLKERSSSYLQNGTVSIDPKISTNSLSFCLDPFSFSNLLESEIQKIKN